MFVALTADVDPDANRPLRGRVGAVSAGHGEDVSLEACRDGLQALLDAAEAHQAPCTLFWEARTLRTLSRTAPGLAKRALDAEFCEHGVHGLRHEDFSGRDTGVPLDEAETLQTLREATEIVSERIGAPPAGFRAPYCRLTPPLRRALAELEFAYDASLTREAGRWDMRPFRLEGTAGRPVWELALCRGRDRAGEAISGYLWQLLEGRRAVADYVEFARHLAETAPEGGLLQIALHPWHLVVAEHGAPLPQGPEIAAEGLSGVLRGIQGLEGVEFTGLGAYLARVAPTHDQ